MSERNGELNARKRMILKAIIETHVRDGEPVGSKYLVNNQQIALSSATIRNEMAELERMGYLEQPHTSAGRIPSENGYRFYVNSLMQRYSMSQNELARMNQLVKSRLAEVDKLLETASRLAAALTNYTSIAVKPSRKSDVIKQIKPVYLSTEMLMLIIVMGDDTVRTVQLHAEVTLTPDMLQRLEFILNSRLSGLRADQITMPLVIEIERSFGEGDSLVGPIIKSICECAGGDDEGEVRLSGVDHLLGYPEYSEDMDKFRNLLYVLENKSNIMKLVTESGDGDGSQIVIGSETGVEEMKNSSIVFRKIKSGGRVIGAIGILGPSRMDYSKVVSTIEYIADNISELIGTGALPEGGTGKDGRSQGENPRGGG